MATSKPQVKAYVTQEVYDKIKIIAEKENRSISNLIETLLNNAIKEHEENNQNTNINNKGTIGNIGNNNGTINI